MNNQNRAKLAVAVAVLIITAIVPSCSRKASVKPTTIRLDYAYYNPVSLVAKGQEVSGAGSRQ